MLSHLERSRIGVIQTRSYNVLRVDPAEVSPRALPAAPTARRMSDLFDVDPAPAPRDPLLVPPSPSTDAMRADAERLRDLARGDANALGALYDAHAPRLRAIAIRLLGSPESAEDLVHDVFLEAARSAGSYDPRRGTVRAWLVVRTRSRALDRLRSARARRERHTPTPPEPRANLYAPLAPELAADAARLRGALASLPDEPREVLHLAYWEGLSSSEIATQLAIPVGTVKSRARRGLVMLRENPTFAEGGAA